ncbi:hypothetical protein M569_06802, partial [Genlisea aurea]
MATLQPSRIRRGNALSAVRNSSISVASSTTASRHYRERSIDESSSVSSSSQTKPLSTNFYPESAPLDVERPKENVTATVRFRPLSPREIRQGEEIAWYADGDTIVRNEHNPSIAYAYDRVFGPTTTTRHVYDVAVQHIVGGAMEGINGAIFAYGVTSSGKTHTMHGDQRSPGLIPLAVKDAFSIIQETPNREFLLRVSYLEIYNEVVNDLLNPAGQNLRIREDAQGTFVEGIKEEVVLSPAHALSLIAAGEEHRHVGSTNFNLQSSRSHTIFTLTVESSPCGENCVGEAVTLSQLNLIDLAGSETSKAETTGLLRKEGSYINKSLLTLGTVISKLTDGRSAHIPYRDSKLTRLLQSSLGGNGRVSLICTLTPSSGYSEETHDTLKFAHRAKHIEIQAAQNKIIDEKSLIKKYQKEIHCLKEELEQLKRGTIKVPKMKDGGDSNILLLKQKLEDGHVEQEEEAKAALMGRIQKLTKLILVSTKARKSSRVTQCSGPLRRHSFEEDELAYLPQRRRDPFYEDENMDLDSLDGNALDDKFKVEKKSKKNGFMSWLKLRKKDAGTGMANSIDKSTGIKSASSLSTSRAASINVDFEAKSHSLVTESVSSARMKHDEDLVDCEDNFFEQETSMADLKSVDETELLKEQKKVLSGEMALHISALKRLSEDSMKNPKQNFRMEISNLKEEILKKKRQIAFLENRIRDSSMPSGEGKLEEIHAVSELIAQLNEKSLELGVKSADNRIIQDQLNEKISECEELQETVGSLRQQISDKMSFNPLNQHRCQNSNEAALLRQAQATEMEELRKKVSELAASKEELESRNRKLSEESSYAKELASEAAVELKALSEEVAKLMNQKNRLTSELLEAQQQQQNKNTKKKKKIPPPQQQQQQRPPGFMLSSDMKRELAARREREHRYEAALAEKEETEAELQKRIEDSKRREAYLEEELTSMWIQVAKLRGEDDDDDES